MKRATSQEYARWRNRAIVFNLKGDWVVMVHNLDDAGDVGQVGGTVRLPN